MLNRRTVIVLLAGLLIVVVAVLVRTGTDDDEAAPPPATPRCGTVQRNDATGAPLPADWLDLVTEIHAAACAGDLRKVESHMGPHYEGDRGDELGVNGGAPLTILAQTLEEPGEVGQGGLVYCHPHGASVIFARSVPGVDAGWTGFWLDDPRHACA
ncbi:hypothetical protein [Actinophytocola sp. KF-1]